MGSHFGRYPLAGRPAPFFGEVLRAVTCARILEEGEPRRPEGSHFSCRTRNLRQGRQSLRATGSGGWLLGGSEAEDPGCWDCRSHGLWGVASPTC